MSESHAGVGLDFVICGLEHSGTTLASDLFRQVPGCDSGFECGVLLCESPREFPSLQPFYNNMIVGWQITEKDLESACSTDSFTGFYDCLYNSSGLFRDNKPSIRFDKTPRYIVNLPAICDTLDVPFVVMIKDPRSLLWSDFRRSKRPLEEIHLWYEEWAPAKLGYMEKAYKGYLEAWQSDQCIVIRLEDLCLRARETFESMFAHVNIEPRVNYMCIRDKRYLNTVGKSISVSVAVEHLLGLPPEIQQRVQTDFGHLDRWFYDF
ncbi:sulfotransferase [Cyanobium sp. CH-040]|uniref:sulfotransferase n=1 Tax=Cyanobium sp. CH-040 TaxID=2823708 RepID=UPI0020CDB2F5|nr:sulfotransferase [Cyanobium sp. CH-040]MCP9927985.1 sulfotransferase [Cyanobium sp. CH-040]